MHRTSCPQCPTFLPPRRNRPHCNPEKPHHHQCWTEPHNGRYRLLSVNPAGLTLPGTQLRLDPHRLASPSLPPPTPCSHRPTSTGRPAVETVHQLATSLCMHQAFTGTPPAIDREHTPQRPASKLGLGSWIWGPSVGIRRTHRLYVSRLARASSPRYHTSPVPPNKHARQDPRLSLGDQSHGSRHPACPERQVV